MIIVCFLVAITECVGSQVDRHIRLLDQSIKEQEASISLGVRPGTHLAPILLPELIVPGSRAARTVAHTPPLADEEGGMTLGMVGGEEDGGEEVQPQRRGRAAAKKVRIRGKPKKEDTVMVLDIERSGSRGRNRNRSRGGTARTLKLSGPAPEVVQVPPPPDEERYCYCNQVSFGEVRGVFFIIIIYFC